MENKRQLVVDFLTNDTDQLQSLVSEMNSYNGCLEHLDVMENDEEFFEIHFAGNPLEAVRAAQYGDYKYSDDYVRFDGYANLESFDKWEYENLLKESLDEIVDALMEEHYHLNLDPELEEIFEEEDEDEE